MENVFRTQQVQGPPGPAANLWQIGPALASAATIAPTQMAHHVTGTAAIATITPPSLTFSGSVILIPDGAWTWTNAGNIAAAGSAVVGVPVFALYDQAVGKWYLK